MVGSDAVADETIGDGEGFVYVYSSFGEVFEDSFGSVEACGSGTDYCGVTWSSRSGFFDGEGEGCFDVAVATSAVERSIEGEEDYSGWRSREQEVGCTWQSYSSHGKNSGSTASFLFLNNPDRRVTFPVCLCFL